MRPSELHYARELFAEIVVTLSVERSIAPTASEAEAIAEKAIDMAADFGADQRRSMSAPVPAFAHIELAKERRSCGGATFAQVARDWMSRAVKRSSGYLAISCGTSLRRAESAADHTGDHIRRSQNTGTAAFQGLRRPITLNRNNPATERTATDIRRIRRAPSMPACKPPRRRHEPASGFS